MTELAADHLHAGRTALAEGRWSEARSSFEAALGEEQSAAALEGLGVACRYLGDAGGAFDAHERAYRFLRRGGDARGAARAAIHLVLAHYNLRGNPAVINGWLRRAHSLLEDVEPGDEHAWVAVLEAHVAILGTHDLAAARLLCRDAGSIAQQTGAVDLQMLALGLDGLALVSAGEVDEGMRRLDEATAAAVGGEMTDLDAIQTVCCYLIYACKRVRDFDRAAQWCEQVKEISSRYSDSLMFAVCRTHYADVLMWQGAWSKADDELDAATREYERAYRHKISDGAVRLAELRRRQGRLDDAATFLERAGAHPLAMLARAALALDRGDPASAADDAERYLRNVPREDLAERVPGLEVALRAQLEIGATERAYGSLSELETIAAALRTDSLNGAARFARGLVLSGEGELNKARRAFEDAVDLYERGSAPFEAAIARLELARALARLGGPGAGREAQAALNAFESLGASRHGSLAARLLRELDRVDGEGLTRREREILRLLAQGLSNHEIAGSFVLSVRTVERHVSNIYAKLGASGPTARAVATAYAVRHGIA